MVILGIFAAVVGAGIVQVIEGYFTAQTNLQTAQKAQLALMRILRECFSLDAAPTSTSAVGMTLDSVVLQWDGATETITLGGESLVDDVERFSISYIYFDVNGNQISETGWSAQSQAMDINLTLQGATQVTYSARAFYPRRGTAP